MTFAAELPKSMKMLLQQAATGLYLESNGKWTDRPKQAQSFGDWIAAYDYTIFNRLSDTFIVPLIEEDYLSISTDAAQLQVSEFDLK
jgi:hypothetical protein